MSESLRTGVELPTVTMIIYLPVVLTSSLVLIFCFSCVLYLTKQYVFRIKPHAGSALLLSLCEMHHVKTYIFTYTRNKNTGQIKSAQADQRLCSSLPRLDIASFYVSKTLKQMLP